MNTSIILQTGGLSLEKRIWWYGVPNLRDFNMTLLASWSKRFFDNRPSDWNKCTSDKPNILWAKPGLGSPFWKCISWAFSAAKTFRRWKLGNGQKVAFWHDLWLCDCSLKTQL